MTFVECPWLDRKNVAIGHLIEGIKVIEALNEIGSQNGIPKTRCVIS